MIRNLSATAMSLGTAIFSAGLLERVFAAAQKPLLFRLRNR